MLAGTFKKEMASNVIVYNKEQRTELRCQLDGKSRKEMTVCTCMCEYHISAANKGSADFEYDLMIERSRLTDPLCICAEECVPAVVSRCQGTSGVCDI